MISRTDDLPIGVFDSGVGGLTVLRALHARLPRESILYLGDMARLPYGSKSSHTVSRYARQAAQILVDRGIKLLVVACNTASAVALDDLRKAFPSLPVIGVVEPGAEAACAVSRTGHVAVIATEATVRGGAYVRAIHALRPEIRVSTVACPLFVALAEEGWHTGPVVEAVVWEYLKSLLEAPMPDVLVLGCTHFPVLGGAIAKIAGPGVRLVDSAFTTAEKVARLLARQKLAADPESPPARVHFLTTDDPEHFLRIAKGFLAAKLVPGEVELVDLYSPEPG